MFYIAFISFITYTCTYLISAMIARHTSICVPTHNLISRLFIIKTNPCNKHPLTPHFCIVKLGLRTGVYRGILSFLIFAPKHRLWVLVRTASLRRF